MLILVHDWTTGLHLGFVIILFVLLLLLFFRGVVFIYLTCTCTSMFTIVINCKQWLNIVCKHWDDCMKLSYSNLPRERYICTPILVIYSVFTFQYFKSLVNFFLNVKCMYINNDRISYPPENGSMSKVTENVIWYPCRHKRHTTKQESCTRSSTQISMKSYPRYLTGIAHFSSIPQDFLSITHPSHPQLCQVSSP